MVSIFSIWWTDAASSCNQRVSFNYQQSWKDWLCFKDHEFSNWCLFNNFQPNIDLGITFINTSTLPYLLLHTLYQIFQGDIKYLRWDENQCLCHIAICEMHPEFTQSARMMYTWAYCHCLNWWLFPLCSSGTAKLFYWRWMNYMIDSNLYHHFLCVLKFHCYCLSTCCG